jgi:hypothetical protein
MVMADGARADTLLSAMDAGQLPALARLRDEGSAHTITSVFPTVTGPAYTPFLMGLHPGRAGIPGIRWYDRARAATHWPGYSRSYVGIEALRADRDLTTAHRTLFEIAPSSLAAFTPHGRGLHAARRMGTGIAFGLRMAWTHFRGDLPGWLALDRQLGRDIATRVRAKRPEIAFVAHPGIDKLSHQLGHGAPEVLDAMRTVDQTVATIRADAERDGVWGDMEIWVVSDHGHSPVSHHEDLAGLLRAWGLRTIAHPWTFTRNAGTHAAVMVSGNAMAHVYLELDRRERPWWPMLQETWQWLLARLLQRPSVDLAILPRSAHEVEVHARGRGMALVLLDQAGRYRYLAETGDPLGIRAVLGAAAARAPFTAGDVHEVTRDTDYPDSLVQVVALAGSARAGEIILSASRDWDFRAKYEPIPHVSSHGALHRDHMLVPLVMSRAATGEPRRTVDVLPSVLAALGRDIPAGLDGIAFR